MPIKPRVPLRISCLGRLAAMVTLAAGFALSGAAAHAQEEVNEVSRLVEQGKMTQAAKLAESYLRQNPNHLQMRFLQGVIAAEQKQNAQAIKVFTALTRDYPQLPEPYNNLAVLYAAEGQERKASEVLEQAIRTNPSYATAHENLGDLYARMASEAYSRALSIDGERQSVKPKLALITQIFPRQGQAVAKAAVEPRDKTERVASAAVPQAVEAKVVAAKSMAAEVKPAEPKLAPAARQAAEPVELPKPQPAKPAVDKPAALVAEAAKPVAAPAEAPRPVPPPAADKPPVAEKHKLEQAKAAEARASASAEVEAVVKAWAVAWAGQDLKRYFDAYSDKFSPADGASLDKWKEVRRQRIVGKNAISVTLKDMKVSINGNEATARFRQNYAAGALKSTTMKTLRLQREGAQWRITHEGTGA